MAAPPTFPADDDLTARQEIGRLMRRVVIMVYGAGVLALLAIWFMEWRDGELSAINAIAYPCLALASATCLVGLWWRPRLLTPVRWIGFGAVTVVLLFELAQEAAQPTPMLGNYNSVTLLNWLPLCYALAFFMLEDRHAAWATASILAFVAGVAAWRGAMDLPSATMDRAMLLNTLVSHAVLVVCLTGMLWLKRVVTRQGEQAQRLKLLAGTDPLTGLANRRQAVRQLERLLGDRRGDSSPAVLLADLDHFKQVNDLCGHETGDRVLTAVAQALREHTRDTDTVARWGGEEFLVIVPRTSAGEAAELAERLRRCVESLSVDDPAGHARNVTLSLGLAALREDDTLATWLSRADDALYRAKANGRNRCEAEGSLEPEAAPA